MQYINGLNYKDDHGKKSAPAESIICIQINMFDMKFYKDFTYFFIWFFFWSVWILSLAVFPFFSIPFFSFKFHRVFFCQPFHMCTCQHVHQRQIIIYLLVYIIHHKYALHKMCVVFLALPHTIYSKIPFGSGMTFFSPFFVLHCVWYLLVSSSFKRLR